MNEVSFALSLLKIPVSDVTRSAEFYRTALGFEEQFVAEKYGWAQLQAGDLPLALYQPGMGGGDGKMGCSVGFHLALPSQRFETLAAELLERGALVEDMVHRADDGTVYVEVRDPDSNTLKIVRSAGD